MSINPISQLKKRTSGKIQIKKNDKCLMTKNDQFGLSTMASKSSTEIRWKKNNNNQEKVIKKKQKGWKKKHPKKHGYTSELPLPLIENSANRFWSEQLEDIFSFREYCMIEGKWIPLLTTTQRQKIKIIEKKPKITEIEQNQTHSDRELIENQLQNIPQNPEPVEVLEEKSVNIPQQPSNNYKLLSEPIEQIDDIFSKLEFFYLPNQTIFKEMPQQQKDHYFKLLQDIIKKMGIKQQFQLNRGKQMGDSDISPVKKLSYMIEPSQKLDEEKKNYHKLIYQRECEQLGMILSEKDRGFESIRTDLATILLYIDTLFELIKTELISDVVSQIKLAYGYRKFEKLRKLLSHEQLQTTPQIIPPSLFHLLEEQNSQQAAFATPHNAAIFDSINYNLLQYKPYYESEGQCFPWNFYMPPSITFYQITEESLEIVLVEVKKKVIEECSMLCGLILDEETEIQAEVLLRARRMEREDIMFKKYLIEQDYRHKEEVELQNSATLVLVQVAFFIQQLLLLEFIQQFRKQ